MTNAQKIRAMSDEELAALLLNGCVGGVCEQHLNEYGSAECGLCRMEWLRQPVKEEQHD